jgi:hypothetical protein
MKLPTENESNSQKKIELRCAILEYKTLNNTPLKFTYIQDY